MDKINVVWLEPDNQWDQHTFELLFSGKMWLPVGKFDFTHHKSFDKVPKTAKGIVLVVPHKYYIDKIDWLNKQIAKFEWLLYIGTGNEEGEFPIEKIEHDNKIVYYTTPHLKNTNFEAIDRLFGDGYAPQSEYLAECSHEVYEKRLDLYFGGQITHARREQAVKAIKHIASENDKVELLETDGFTKGYDDYKTYYQRLASAKIVPCPSGPKTPDTFRSYEALQAMALPILDSRTVADAEATNYWTKLFGEEPPMPIIKDDWESLNGYTKDILEDWHTHINKAVSWWITKKRQYAYDLVADLEKLTGKQAETTLKDRVTVLIPTSTVPTNPDTAFIERTIADIRTKLPDCEIILMIDGLREEQQFRLKEYNEYKKRVIWNCLHKWQNVLPLLFDEHQHQANMTRYALELVNTPTILFAEHDAPITPDKDFFFQWDQLIDAILEGQAHVIRFHFEGSIPDAHKHLMIGEPELVHGVKLLKTTQWSQRPHLASTAFYKQMIDTYFGSESRTMIEDVIHGVITQYFDHDGIMGWHLFKLWIYHPDGGNIKRSYHIDARGQDPKYGMKIAYKGETPRFAPQPKTTGTEPGK